MELMEWFRSGGYFMYYIVMADTAVVILLALSFAFCSKALHSTINKICIVFLIIPLLVGLLGHYFGYVAAVDALANVDPATREELYDASMTVATIPSIFGLVSSVVFFLLWYVAFVMRRPQQE